MNGRTNAIISQPFGAENRSAIAARRATGAQFQERNRFQSGTTQLES